MNNEPPRVPVRLHENGVNLVFTEPCPFCKKKHWHGIGGGLEADGTYGHRISHCGYPHVRGDDDVGYILIPAEPGPAESEKPRKQNARRRQAR